MGTRPAGTAEDISSNVRTIVDRVLEADVTDAIAQRGRELAAAVGEATEAAVERAGVTWRDTAPVRSEAMKAARSASRDAGRWGSSTWRKELRPRFRDLWNRRTVAMGAAGAAIPAGRGLAETAAERFGLKQREERHWGAFFLGLLLGIAGGVAAALLTAPKRGSELRVELGDRAQSAVEVVSEKAQAVADDWVPLFQRDLPAEAEAAATDTFEAVEMAGDGGPAVDEMSDAVAHEVDEREQS